MKARRKQIPAMSHAQMLTNESRERMRTIFCVKGNNTVLSPGNCLLGFRQRWSNAQITLPEFFAFVVYADQSRANESFYKVTVYEFDLVDNCDHINRTKTLTKVAAELNDNVSTYHVNEYFKDLEVRVFF